MSHSKGYLSASAASYVGTLISINSSTTTTKIMTEEELLPTQVSQDIAPIDEPSLDSAGDVESPPGSTQTPLRAPDAFATKCFWPFQGSSTNDDNITSTSSSTTLTFVEGVVPTAIAAVASSFTTTAQLESMVLSDLDSKGAREPCVALCCPQNGAHAVLDAMVRRIADAFHADVVVLDPLELVMGGEGVLGKGMYLSLLCGGGNKG